MEYGHLNLSDPAIKSAYIEQIKEMHGEYEILHYKVLPKRENSQNAYYFVLLSIISSESGNRPEDLHLLFKKMFAKKAKANPKGTISTANMSVSEFDSYLSMIKIWFIDMFGRDFDEEYYP